MFILIEDFTEIQWFFLLNVVFNNKNFVRLLKNKFMECIIIVIVSLRELLDILDSLLCLGVPYSQLYRQSGQLNV